MILLWWPAVLAALATGSPTRHTREATLGLLGSLARPVLDIKNGILNLFKPRRAPNHNSYHAPAPIHYQPSPGYVVPPADPPVYEPAAIEYQPAQTYYQPSAQSYVVEPADPPIYYETEAVEPEKQVGAVELQPAPPLTPLLHPDAVANTVGALVVTEATGVFSRISQICYTDIL